MADRRGIESSEFPAIEGFKILEELGMGGMGTVYRAVQTEFDRQVALKLVHRQLGRDAEFRERFRDEMQIATSLQHPNIVPVYAAGESGRDLFMAMMLVPGSDLATLVDREGSMAAEAAVAIVRQVASALDEAHRQRLIHRDVKPQNVIVDERNSHAYLTDFGIARSLDATSGLTATGHQVGTIEYMSPEQLDGKPVDHRTDIYSLSCLLYALVSGDRPFEADSIGATIRMKLDGPSRPSLQRLGFSPALSDVIERAQAVDPDARYSSAGEFADAAGAAVGAPMTTPAATFASHGRTQPMSDRRRPDPRARPTSRIPEEDTRTRRRSWALLGSLAAVALAVIGAVTALALTGGSSNGGAAPATADAPTQTSTTTTTETTTTAEPPTPSRTQTGTQAFVPFTGNLYTAEVPKGWNQETTEEKNSGRYTSQWRDPNDSNTSVLIDSQPTTTGTVLEGAESVRAQTSQTPGYEEISFESTKLNGVKAVRWVFDVPEDRRVDYFLSECGAGFAILGSTSPDRFDEMEPTFRHVAESLVPIYCE